MFADEKSLLKMKSLITVTSYFVLKKSCDNILFFRINTIVKLA